MLLQALDTECYVNAVRMLRQYYYYCRRFCTDVAAVTACSPRPHGRGSSSTCDAVDSGGTEREDYLSGYMMHDTRHARSLAFSLIRFRLQNKEIVFETAYRKQGGQRARVIER